MENNEMIIDDFFAQLEVLAKEIEEENERSES